MEAFYKYKLDENTNINIIVSSPARILKVITNVNISSPYHLCLLHLLGLSSGKENISGHVIMGRWRWGRGGRKSIIQPSNLYNTLDLKLFLLGHRKSSSKLNVH